MACSEFADFIDRKNDENKVSLLCAKLEKNNILKIMFFLNSKNATI